MAATKERITILVEKEFFDDYKQACKELKTTMTAPLRQKAEDVTAAWKATQNQPVPPT